MPHGRLGLSLFTSFGVAALLLAMTLSFASPAQIIIGGPATYVAMLVGVTVLLLAVPLVIHALRKLY